ncbi:universal stress protein [Roseobacter weihaiensis]|uniref:universal stress protein n=1 Tax=Roseobacter weihaiensis TaxID=2763262 RepID=UPI001D0BC61A|nr:universal stress protein [Roseobacter sp. H9]
MERATVLFVVTQDTPDEVISELAEASAQEQMHLSCMLLGIAPPLPMYAYGVPPYGTMSVPDNWAEVTNAANDRQNQRAEQIEGLLARSGTSGDVLSHLCATMDMKHLVARRARVCDIAHFASDLSDTPDILREAAHGILFQSPIGLILNDTPCLKPQRIFVAWNRSDAVSKAVHLALPYLKNAQEVIIGCFDPVMTPEKEGADPGTDVAAWLSHHGCNVTVSQYPSGGEEIAQGIQDRAKEVGADLVVMGAYGHARLMEAVFGGTTRTMMEQTELPVLMAH